VGATQIMPQKAASESVQSLLRDAWLGMAGQVSRPQSHKWRFDDAVKGRPMRFLGSYPEVAEACIEAGAEYHDVTAPLEVMRAHIRRRYGMIGGCLKTAIAKAEKEEADAECAETGLAFEVGSPSHATLAAYVKEKTEQILAEEAALQIAKDLMYAGGAK
jgi:hypothetical protein